MDRSRTRIAIASLGLALVGLVLSCGGADADPMNGEGSSGGSGSTLATTIDDVTSTSAANTTGADAPPLVGALDAIAPSGVAMGWAAAPSMVPDPIEVAFYLDGVEGAGTMLGQITADVPRGDVEEAGFPGDHGFEFPIPDAYRDDLPHELYAYAVGPDQTLALGSLPFTLSAGTVDPEDYTVEQLRHLQGDLMLWVPELKPVYEGDIDPVTGIRRVSDMGVVPEGLANGWIWSITIDRYPPEDREIIYQAALAEGFTHFAVQVTQCQPSEGYHGLTPVTAEDCVDADAELDQILHELWNHGLIPLCTGVSPTDPVAPGLDKSLCRVVLNDWDNSAEADCHIKVLAETFPEAQIIFEIPDGAITPAPDSCSPMPFPATGTEWIANVQRLYPNFFAVAYEVNYPDGLDANQAQLEQAHAWWSGVQEIRFEIDTYWKFWDNLDHDVARQYNDDLQQRVPWLVGFMSGGTTTARGSLGAPQDRRPP